MISLRARLYSRIWLAFNFSGCYARQFQRSCIRTSQSARGNSCNFPETLNYPVTPHDIYLFRRVIRAVFLLPKMCFTFKKSLSLAFIDSKSPRVILEKRSIPVSHRTSLNECVVYWIERVWICRYIRFVYLQTCCLFVGCHSKAIASGSNKLSKTIDTLRTSQTLRHFG